MTIKLYIRRQEAMDSVLKANDTFQSPTHNATASTGQFFCSKNVREDTTTKKRSNEYVHVFASHRNRNRWIWTMLRWIPIIFHTIESYNSWKDSNNIQNRNSTNTQINTSKAVSIHFYAKAPKLRQTIKEKWCFRWYKI